LEDRQLLTTITVTSLADDDDHDDGKVTLREALYAANHDTSVDGSAAGNGDDTIMLDPALYEHGRATIRLTRNFELQIMSNVTIDGPAPGLLTIQAGKGHRVFYVGSEADAEIQGLTIRGGHASSDSCQQAGSGGGIHNDGALTLDDVRIYENRADWHGGGIYSQGELSLTNVELRSNDARRYGGGICGFGNGTATLVDVDVRGNEATLGGGICGGSVAWTISDSWFLGNSARSNGGGIYGAGGTWQITDTIFAGNSAGEDGGGIAGAGGGWTITNTELWINEARGVGGAIHGRGGTWEIRDGTIVHNWAVLGGGGVCGERNSAWTVSSTTISDNHAGWCGGGVAGAGYSSWTVSNSTISDNEVVLVGGGICGLDDSTWTLKNSTISGNATDLYGGGIFSWGSPTWTVSNATIAANRCDNDDDGVGNGGGIYVDSGTVTLHSTIVAGNFRGSLARRDVWGEFDDDSSYNLIGVIRDSNGLKGNGTQWGTAANPLDAMLAPLGDYGGLTQTHALLPGSPAVDRGDNPLGLTGDQRGADRTSGRGTDVGAFELQARAVRAATGSVKYPSATLCHKGATSKKLDSNRNAIFDAPQVSDFQNERQRKVHGLGCHADLSRNVDRVFELYGTEDWAIPDFEDYFAKIRR